MGAPHYTVALQKIAAEQGLTVLHAAQDYATREIRTADVNRPGLQLAGFYNYFDPERMQIIGRVESTYLETLTPDQRRERFEQFMRYNIIGLVICHGMDPFPECLEMAEKYDRNLFLVRKDTSEFMADLIAYVRDGTPLPEKPIILSFDDGYYNNYVYVLPLLQQYSARIVLSLLGRNTDDFTEWPSESIDYAHVTWDQLNEMLDTGLVEVQNHSYNLHAYTSERHGCMQNRGESDAAYAELLRADLQRLQDELAEHTGRTPDTFAYPYGKYGDLTDTVLCDMGFQATLTCDWGVNHITRDPDCLYRLGRICRSHNQSLQSVLRRALKATA